MKNVFFAAIAALTLGAAIVPAAHASSIFGDHVATRMQQTGSYQSGS